MPTLFDKPHNNFGSVISRPDSSNADFSFIRENLSTILSNISSSLVHSEFKLKGYAAYAFPSFEMPFTGLRLSSALLKAFLLAAVLSHDFLSALVLPLLSVSILCQ